MTGTKERNVPIQPESKEQSRNRVLSRLSAGEYARVEPDLELVSLAFGQVVYEFKSTIRERLELTARECYRLMKGRPNSHAF